MNLRRAFLPMALGLALTVPAAAAHAATINFDDLDAPGKDSGTGLVVNTHYNGQGVTFNDMQAFDYSKPTAIPGFAHSGTVGVEQCAGAEFCKVPIQATFTTAQRSVRVWVGFSSPHPDPVGVQLTTFNASDGVVGTANATLPASSSPNPIQTPLEVDRPPARIVKLEVSVTTGGGFTSGLAVDDVEFSTVGPPPPCAATEPPFVNVTQPSASQFVHNNEFRLQGTIATGAPITSASVIATSESGATRTASIYPSVVRSEGGSFGPVRFNGLLFSPSPGTHDIVVTATNCRGTGTSDPRRVLWTPLPPTTRFRQLGPIEVTQSVQTTLNSVPLIAAGPNSLKRTFARVYLRVEGGAESVSHVSGSLTAVRPDGSRPPGPLRVFSINSGSAFIGSGSLPELRPALNDPLLFELPPEWLDAGRLHLELEHIYVEGAESTFPCDDCGNIGPSGPPPVQLGPATVRFHETPPVRLELISMPFRLTPAGTPLTPSQNEIDGMASMIRRMYPTGDLQVNQAVMPIAGGPPKTCQEARERVQDFASAVGAQNPRMRFLGLLERDTAFKVKDKDDNIVGGCAQRPGQYGWVYADDEAGGAHELGHMYGRKHVAGCTLFEGSSTDTGYPHPGGLIGSELFGDALGFDAGDSALGISKDLLDWRDGFADVMTYCDDQWLSDYNYGNILGTLCDEDPANCPDQAVISPRRRGRAMVAAETATKKARGPRLHVTGTLPRRARASFDSLAVMHGLKLTPRPRKSPYAVVLRDARGRTVGRYPFKPSEVGEDSTLSVDEVVPFKRVTRRITIVKGRRTLDSARVSPHRPSAELTSPTKKRLRGAVKVRWRVRDADGGHPRVTLLYTPDGKRYIPVAADLRKRSYRVDLAALPGGKRAAFRVVANDGVLTGRDDSTRLRVPAKAPLVSIATPAPGTALTADQPVQLAATVLDLQDPRFESERLAWRSSLQGELGSGQAISAGLSPGTHEITATATNSRGKSASATVSVQVDAVPPVVVAEAVGP
jgi:hypothetical protein